MPGIHPSAGQDWCYLGSTGFSKATVDNKYIADARPNGKPWPQARLRHADVTDGAVQQMTMQARPAPWDTRTLPPSPSQAQP